MYLEWNSEFELKVKNIKCKIFNLFNIHYFLNKYTETHKIISLTYLRFDDFTLGKHDVMRWNQLVNRPLRFCAFFSDMDQGNHKSKHAVLEAIKQLKNS